MIRKAFIMKLKKGYEKEYKRRHEQIWPELKELLKEQGVYDYSIFLHEDSSTLFAVQKNSSLKGSQDLKDNPVIQRWWAYMKDIMETHEDNSPVSIELDEVFYLP
ncbi:MAG: L-rhamnose mutarotase [Spirochaetia bacterium]|nr:L-rhamnose mutarotase [Spirochaetia bacterium]